MEERDREGGTIYGLLKGIAERIPDNIAMRRKDKTTGEWESIRWKGLEEAVRYLSTFLIRMGIQKGDRVAILSQSRTEWAVADLSIMAIGAVTIPIYPSNLPHEVKYILEHSGSRLVFVEDREQAGKVLEVKTELPLIENIVIFDGKVRDDSLFIKGWKRCIEEGREAWLEDPSLFEKANSQVFPIDIATICYTSGTTGPPKGAVITHGNILFELSIIDEVLPASQADETLLFLPMAHIFARVGYLMSLKKGYTISYAESMDTLLQNLKEIRPTFVFSVPRVYEKVFSTVSAKVKSGSLLAKMIFRFSYGIGRTVSRRLQKGKGVPFYLAIMREMAEILFFRRIASIFGGELRFCIAGGAPLSREIAEFFHAVGVLILEGYGLTENVAAVNINRPDNYCFGTVGPPLPGVQIRIAEDGEILLKGDNIFQGYYKREDEAGEAFSNGWFRTGDIGEFTPGGFLKITDRKKDLIVTAGGKNIAPQNIENRLKTDRYISQVMVYGDRKPYLVALLTLNEEEVKRFAIERELEWETFPELVRHPLVERLVKKVVEEKNRDLASFETIKRYHVLDKDFEVGEELTPTLKVKRKVVTRKYLDLIERLYEG